VSRLPEALLEHRFQHLLGAPRRVRSRPLPAPHTHACLNGAVRTVRAGPRRGREERDIAGKGIANPIAAIWAGAMMLDHLGERPAHDRILKAIESVLSDERVKTPDLGGRATTAEMMTAVTAAMTATRQPA
jgi:hypothetical protein